MGFVGRQFLLQALNPTIESKIYNPVSALGIVGAGDAWDAVTDVFSGDFKFGEFASKLAGLGASLLLGIGHPERHFGGLRYEDVNPIKKLKKDSGAGEVIYNIPVIGRIALPIINKKIGALEGGSLSRLQSISKFIDKLDNKNHFANSKKGMARMVLANPNKYAFPISSAPVSIERGVPSFKSGTDVAQSHAHRISKVKGGTFNKKSGFNNTTDIKRYERSK